MRNSTFQMINNIELKPIIAFLVIIWPILLMCMILIVSGTVTMSYHGIAVDSSGRLYIGTDDDIEVYENGKLINTISPQTTRGYVFTINENDVIILSIGSTAYEISTSGNVLAVIPDNTTAMYNRISKTVKNHVSGNGADYTVDSILGRTVVTCNGNTVYKMPLLDYAVKTCVNLLIISIFVFAFVIVCKAKAREK